VLELLRTLLPTLGAFFRDRHDLVVENLLLRHQLHISLRSRPRSCAVTLGLGQIKAR
jgi:hypothetical protein